MPQRCTGKLHGQQVSWLCCIESRYLNIHLSIVRDWVIPPDLQDMATDVKYCIGQRKPIFARSIRTDEVVLETVLPWPKIVKLGLSDRLRFSRERIDRVTESGRPGLSWPSEIICTSAFLKFCFSSAK